jgi:hypothetical protein
VSPLLVEDEIMTRFKVKKELPSRSSYYQEFSIVASGFLFQNGQVRQLGLDRKGFMNV